MFPSCFQFPENVIENDTDPDPPPLLLLVTETTPVDDVDEFDVFSELLLFALIDNSILNVPSSCITKVDSESGSFHVPTADISAELSIAFSVFCSSSALSPGSFFSESSFVNREKPEILFEIYLGQNKLFLFIK